LNDSYHGVYVLGEQLKLHESRVAVDDSRISGGYLLEMTSQGRAQAERFFTTPVQQQAVVYDDPNKLSFGRAAWIRRYVSRFERTLYSNQFMDRRLGYRRYLDMGAAVDYLLFNELFRNTDTFTYSTYMHKSVGGKLVLGPVWDFDQAIGRYYPEPAFNSREGWQYTIRFRQAVPGQGSPWAGRLYADPAFRARMVRHWIELRRQGLERHIMEAIDAGTLQLAGGPRERNHSRWPPSEIPENERVVDPRTGVAPADQAQAVDYLKWWLQGRIAWIDQNVNTLQP
jgi:CotH kinase protein